MKYIYMDNFRGFTDTIIPLRQVNFLVGENSTGKSSLLGLLELLAEPPFWFTQDFNHQTYEFGGFSDIVSAAAAERHEFRIGICNDGSGGKNNGESFCFLMNFREEEGIPIISRFSQVFKDLVGTIVVRSKRLYYRIDKLQDVCTEPGDPCCLLRSVGTHSRQMSSGFSKVPKVFGLGRRSLLAAFPTVLKLLSKGETVKRLTQLEIPDFLTNFIVLAPIRTKPKRTYDGYGKPFSPEGEHTPYILRKQLASKSKAQAFRSALEKFGKESGLFKRVGVKQFGKESSAPFELTVTLGEQPLKINTVGYGVSQTLPVVVELISRRSGSCFSIQQPEIHLHPKAQAALGDLLFAVAFSENKTLFIETHSDYLIDRFRLNYRQKKGPDAQVLFFERGDGENRVHIMPIGEDGEYPEEQPSSFRTFFLNEQRRILGI